MRGNGNQIEVKMTNDSCRPYLINPHRTDKDAAAGFAKAVFAAGDVAACLVRWDGGERALGALAEELSPLAARHDVALLLEDRPALAVSLGLDGVHLSDGAASCARARALLGPERIVGAGCGRSRDEAMRAGEAGADYVALGGNSRPGPELAPFAADRDLANWWAELFEVPCVLMPAKFGAIADVRCEFLAPPADYWAGHGDPAQQFEALERALRAQAKAA